MAELSEPVTFDVLQQAFQDAIGALQDAEVQFAIAGSFAVWARSGSEPPLVEDIDVVVRPTDVPAAAQALRDAGFRIEIPPEGWLVKAFHTAHNGAGEHLFVDIIHHMAGLPIDDRIFERASMVSVAAMEMSCLAAIDMMASGLLAVSASVLDYTGTVEKARLLREQFSWDELERRASDEPAAMAFFDIARRLGIDPRHPVQDASGLVDVHFRSTRRLPREVLDQVRAIAGG